MTRGGWGCSVGVMPLGQLIPEGRKTLAKNVRTRPGRMTRQWGLDWLWLGLHFTQVECSDGVEDCLERGKSEGRKICLMVRERIQGELGQWQWGWKRGERWERYSWDEFINWLDLGVQGGEGVVKMIQFSPSPFHSLSNYWAQLWSIFFFFFFFP